MKPKESAYATKHEIEFIDGLGTFSPHKFVRKQLLNKYLMSVRDRKTWGDIEKNVVTNHAMRAYLSETK